MIFVIQTNDEIAGLDITKALSDAGIEHTILSKQHDEAAQPTLAPDAATEPYFDDSLPEEYIEGVIYRRNRPAANANR